MERVDHNHPDPRRIEVMDDDMADILRAKSGAERLRIAFEMYESTRRMLTYMLKGDHPDWSEERIRREVSRSSLMTQEGFESSFSSAEDVILMKMEFFRQGGSDKHLRDITGILKLRGDRLDTDYIENWADQMGLETIWRTLRSRVKQ